MSTKDLALASLEKAINTLLDLDPWSRQRLARHHGRVIGVHLDGPELSLYFIPDQDGRLMVHSHIEGPPDALLAGSPLDLLRSSDPEQGPRQLFAGKLRISGDTRLAQDFGATLAGLDIDWEEQLAKFTGDVIAHQIGDALRSLFEYGRTTASRLQLDVGEYLTEESGLLAHPFAVQDFIDSVDRLREDADRLEARLQWLERKIAAES